MSADNWGICPRCKKESQKEIRQFSKKVEVGFNLREDYEIGIDGEDSEFYVTYKAICSVCDFWFEFKYQERVEKQNE